MHLTKFFTVAAVVTTGVLAAPGKQPAPKPAPPPAPTTISQSNTCGNGATPYCCTTDNLGLYTSCYVLGGQNSICSATTVCCNANNSIQVCLGSAQILTGP